MNISRSRESPRTLFVNFVNLPYLDHKCDSITFSTNTVLHLAHPYKMKHINMSPWVTCAFLRGIPNKTVSAFANDRSVVKIACHHAHGVP